MEQSTPKQGLIASWSPCCSSEASASYSQSASSAVFSPACEAQCVSSAHTDSSPIKEHDYIGLAEITSSPASLTEPEQKLHVYSASHDDDEPDLRLGLGPSAAKGACGNASSHTYFEPKSDVVKDQSACSASSTKRLDVKLMCIAAADSNAKNVKRPFSDTIVQVAPDVRLVAQAAGEDVKPGVMSSTRGQVRMVMRKPDVDTKPMSKHPQMVYWATPGASSWCSELAHTACSYGQLASGKPPTNIPNCMPPSGNLILRNQEPTPDEAPPAKEQVVGWPPVRSYRRSAIAAQSSRSCESNGDMQLAIYVKVNMDGIPIGRKIDLSVYSSYEELLVALEGMFHSPLIGESVRFLHARDFVLTYEDKEGDWMLVGDVPWSMFVNTVKRLRIMRGSDSACLGSSTSKNIP